MTTTRHLPRNRRRWWIYGATDGRDVTLLGFGSEDAAQDHYGRWKFSGVRFNTIGICSRRVTEDRALVALRDRFPFAPVHVVDMTADDPTDGRGDEAHYAND